MESPAGHQQQKEEKYEKRKKILCRKSRRDLHSRASSAPRISPKVVWPQGRPKVGAFVQLFAFRGRRGYRVVNPLGRQRPEALEGAAPQPTPSQASEGALEASFKGFWESPKKLKTL